jgi:hypothetical protein
VISQDSGETMDSKSENNNIIDATLTDHKPLGCTVEESLAPYSFSSNKDEEVLIHEEAFPVFISKIVQGGHADQAGLQAGDVIVGISGVFDQLQDVSYDGIEKV